MNRHRIITLLIIAFLSCLLSAKAQEDMVYELPENTGTGEVAIRGEMKKWHKISLSFSGPTYSETNTEPNPFLDYRLNVTFSNGNKTYIVPGYFAADGNAAESSAETGNVWRVHFSPDTEGTWTYTVSFRLGGWVAINDDVDAGIAVAPINGKTGSFDIAPTDKSGIDNRANGRLNYVNDHYLRYAETNKIFIKAGADAPENFLSYEDFDNTPNYNNLRKNWAAHAEDYKTGDPSWQDGKGTEIIGAVNYLASKGLNVFSFLTMNIEGDDRNAFPYISYTNYYQFDCSKLDQWEIVFSHAETLGMYLHFKTQETENETLLDNGDLGVERKLYYRELIARFGHHLALNWNLGEENGSYPNASLGNKDQNTTQRKAMAQYFSDHDPYKHLIVIHTAPGEQNNIYTPLLGENSALTGVSLQTGWNNSHKETMLWIKNSEKAKKRWVVAHDEQNSHQIGVPEDTYTGTPSKHDIRKQTLWGNFMAGGAGVEYYFGYERPESDLNCNNWKIRSDSWDYARYALEFFRKLPLDLMVSSDELVTNGWCFAETGSTYAVYLNNGGTSDLTLNNDAQYIIKWYNPRTGGELVEGSVKSIAGKGKQNIGTPPSDQDEDWAALITLDITNNKPPVAAISADKLIGNIPFTVNFDATESTDNDGNVMEYDWDFGDGVIAKNNNTAHTFNFEGIHRVTLKVTDDKGATNTTYVYIEVRKKLSENSCGDYIEMLSKDFSYEGTDFYLDEFIGDPILAITPTPPNVATASVSIDFTGETCLYNLTLETVGENDGQSEFKIIVNEVELGSFLVPLSTQPWEVGNNYNYTWQNIPLKNGDRITVEGKTGTDGEEWSRARWIKLAFTPSSAPCEANYIEENGLVVIEAEKLNLPAGWQIGSEAQGFTGNGYIDWTAGDNFSTTGNGLIEETIKINTPGVYHIEWHVKVGEGASSTDFNDSWLRFPDAADYYGMRSVGDTVRPHGVCTNNCPEGAGSDGWFKVFLSGTTNWTWSTLTSDNEDYSIYVKFDTPGLYKLQLSGRSVHHFIDRIVLYEETVSQSLARSLTLKETRCGDDGVMIYPNERIYQAKEMLVNELIDGVETVKAWEGIDEATCVFETEGNPLPASTDASCKFKVAFDNEYLYLLATVTDQTKQAYDNSGSGQELWDNIELYINPDLKHYENGVYGDDAIQIRMNYGSTNNSFSGNGTWKGDAEHSGFEYITVDTNNGYILEAKIPWNGILPEGINAVLGNSFGFELVLNDNDDGSDVETSIAWSNNTGRNVAGADTRVFGTMMLAKNNSVKGPYSGTPSNIPGVIEAEFYDFGGQGTSYNDNTIKDGDQSFRANDNVDFGTLADGYAIAWFDNGEWLKYTVDIEEGMYSISALAASGITSLGKLTLSVNDKKIGEVAIEATGDWNEFKTFTTEQVNLVGSNNSTLKITSSGGFNLDKLTFIKTGEFNSISEKAIAFSPLIYPNPVNDVLNIEFEQITNPKVEVYNIYGKLIISTKSNQIDVNKLAKGIYIMNVESKYYTRFIKN